MFAVRKNTTTAEPVSRKNRPRDREEALVALFALVGVITMDEAMALLKVSRSTIYHLVAHGAFPIVKISGSTRFRPVDLEMYIASRLVYGRPS